MKLAEKIALCLVVYLTNFFVPSLTMERLHTKAARRLDFSGQAAERNQPFTPPTEQDVKKIANLLNSISEIQQTIIQKQKTITEDQQQLTAVIRNRKMLKAFFRKRHRETRFFGQKLRRPASLTRFDVEQAHSMLNRLNLYVDRADRKLRYNKMRIRRIPLEVAACKDTKRKLIPQLKQLTLTANFNNAKISLAIGSTLQTLSNINQNEHSIMQTLKPKKDQLNVRCLEKLH
jgi:hypothetical protein